MRTTVGQFGRACQEQGVKISPNVLRVDPTNSEKTFVPFDIEAHPDIYAPSAIARALYLAGAQLRARPGEPLILTENPIENTACTARFDTMARILLALLNDSLVGANTSHTPSFEPSHKSAPACKWSEVHFASTLKSKPPGGFHVVTDQARQPLIIRKVRGANTGLTVAPLAIGSISVAEGSLVRIRMHAETVESILISTTDYRHWQNNEVASLEFVRPTLYAIPVDERADLMNTTLTEQSPEIIHTPHLLNTIRTATVEDFRRFASATLAGS